jgi:hypothetical protein
MHAPMQCCKNAIAYFAVAVSYGRKIFMKLTPGFHGNFLAARRVHVLADFPRDSFAVLPRPELAVDPRNLLAGRAVVGCRGRLALFDKFGFALVFVSCRTFFVLDDGTF